MGASWLTIQAYRIREATGKLLTRLRVPGAISNTVVEDTLTGQNIEVRVGALFTRISINGRDYYFNRLTGKFDGTGMGCL
jgi:hypothetical protein